MAFALTKFQAWPIRPAVPVNMTGFQYAYFEFTAAATDLIVDLGTAASQFYTDIGATQIGVNCLASMQAIQGQVSSLISTDSPQLIPRVQVLTLSAISQFQSLIVNNSPKITSFTADGPTSWQMLICWKLSANNFGLDRDSST